jgi:hypothetical protein
MPKRYLLYLFAIGLTIGGTATTLYWAHTIRALPSVPKKDSPRVDHSDLLAVTNAWLLPPGSTFETVCPSPVARRILEAPDKVTIHPAVEKNTLGALTVGGFYFGSQEVLVEEPFRHSLLFALRSVSSYRALSSCLFSPVVLVRCTRDDTTLNMLFCLTCDDVRSSLDPPAGDDFVLSGGLSSLGRSSFIIQFSHLLPMSKPLQDLLAAEVERLGARL